jgi:pimeloyl-ACP methyl ester carboxylesterase
VRFPESEWEATAEFNPNGSFRRMKASNEINQKVLTAAAHPLFGKVHAPALAIYAQVEIRSVFPDYDNLDAQNQQRAEGYAGELKARAEASMRQLRSELPSARVVVLNPANHAVFLSNESDVLRLMQDFLANVK